MLLGWLGLAALSAWACERRGHPASSSVGSSAGAARDAQPATRDSAVGAVSRAAGASSADSTLPAGDDPVAVSIRRGHAILAATHDSLPAYSLNALRCTSCHLDDGRRAGAIPFTGVYARFPQYRSRSGRVAVIEDRVNDCLVRSMNGKPLPAGSREMRDIVAYFAWVSRGVAVGDTVPGQGLVRLKTLDGDSVRGAALFVANCARCHGASGEGTALAPPLWGGRSFNVGAGMARVRTLAAFVRHNMPFDRPGTLTDQQAFDIAAYVASRPRPDLAGKENDWPNGDAPPDAAYHTKAAAKSRRGALAPPPPSSSRSRAGGEP